MRKQSARFGILICAAAAAVFGLQSIQISDGSRSSAAEPEIPEPAATEAPAASAEKEEESPANGYFTQPAVGVLTSGYGVRWGRNHNGIDIGADTGADVYAADGGVVTYAAVCGGYGNYIMIDHQNGYQTAYGHLDEILASDGDVVRAGQLIGKVGSTGNSTGPHLHFEVRAGDLFLDPLNYVTY